MAARKLTTRSVEKPWGRDTLPALFSNPDGQRIGEIWFEGPQGQHPALLVKYIFTSEKLSVQVHPTDAQAHARGLAGGKSECWYILDAEPGATLGIGLTHSLSAEHLRTAAEDGTIEGLIDWKPVQAGDFFYIGAGTIHAIGGGVTLVEIQQNNDVTYRLYDYGRPRELHLDDGVAVGRRDPFVVPHANVPIGATTILVDGKHGQPFTQAMATWDAGARLTIDAGPAWFAPLTGAGTLDGQSWAQGECWLIDDAAALVVNEKTTALVARAT